MVEHCSSPNQYVYHYTSAATALDYILESRTLRFGEYTGTNDPKETKSWFFDLITFENRDLGRYRQAEVSKWLSAQLKSRTKMACFSTDSSPLTGFHLDDIYQRGYSKARMWAQYGDRHRGVCLVFDRAKLTARIKREFAHSVILFGSVTYRDASLVRSIERHEFNIDVDLLQTKTPSEYVKAHLSRYARPLFFEKLLDWRDEAEWRVVILAEASGSLYLPIDDSLVAVVHGDATDPDASEALMAKTNSDQVQHLGISWKNSSPWYDYESFAWKPGKITGPRRSRIAA